MRLSKDYLQVLMKVSGGSNPQDIMGAVITSVFPEHDCAILYFIRIHDVIL